TTGRTITMTNDGHRPPAWDEPEGAVSPRGWLKRDGTTAGFYLDYGPDHYRSPHGETRSDGRYVQYCHPDRLCPECQPRSILAVRYPDGPGTDSTSRYVETIAEARRYVETGEDVTRQTEPGLEELEADPEIMAEASRILAGEGGTILGIPFAASKH